MADKEEEVDILAGCMLTLISLPIFILWGGFVAWMLCGWFVTPLGVPTIGFAHTCGLMGFVRLLTYSKSSEKDERPMLTKSVESITLSVIGPAMSFGIGWLFHLAM